MQTAPRHKNKTLATFLAALLGGIGAHRFYLYGPRDFWGWIHAACLPLATLLVIAYPGQPRLYTGAPLVVSVLAGLIEALVIGLTADDKWDSRFNPASGRSSRSGWPLAILLVLTLGFGAIALIAAIARAFDLLYTGGAYG
ncbi:NINE protein [Noviherbaspirillum galbum]|uniref:TM2 domain-containing protein n=1 Tax=Noviherbaspirillum galbum TaxID=2709383 RepID=A0A6B3SI25_9BURK|nr:NINE protein [Noviherbaspirillum galbum]NEX60497.1 TM2 domain-containing protein [Noviherbaspirillum galbum]